VSYDDQDWVPEDTEMVREKRKKGVGEEKEKRKKRVQEITFLLFRRRTTKKT